MTHHDILLVGTPRQSCALRDLIWPGADRLILGSMQEEDVRACVSQIARWKAAHPDGAVVSLSDAPSLAHALSGEPGASLDVVLATLDKAWARAEVLKGLDAGSWLPVTSSDAHVPRPNDSLRVIVKPLEACASAGIHVLCAGDLVPKDMLAPAGWLEGLRAQRIGQRPYPDDTIALVEAYIPPHIPRVSVDGWIGARGEVYRHAISDNMYAEDDPERFSHQSFPSRISADAKEACWALYRAIATRLHRTHGMHSQPFDVEMFVCADDRIEVMEINARIHPNILPILQRCLRHAHPIKAHISPPTQHACAEGAAYRAGVMHYVWMPEGAPMWQPKGLDEHACYCAFDEPGTPRGGLVCHGWLYLFGDDVAALNTKARRLIAGAS